MLNQKIKDYFTIKKKERRLQKRITNFVRKISKVNNKKKMKKKNFISLVESLKC